MDAAVAWFRRGGQRVLCVLGLLLAATEPGRGASAAPLRVVMDNNYPPFVFQDNEGKLQGILIDQWRLWEKQTGTAVELQALSWAEALQRMRAGEFDVIDTIFKTDERASYLDYTRPYARIEVPIFFDRDISGITDAASLRGFPFAAKAGDAVVELLRDKGATNALLYTNYQSIVEAAARHKVNVFVVDKPPAIYFLNKLGLQEQFRQSAPINVGEFHRAVAKGNAELLRRVEAGFAALPPDALKQIEERWYGTNLNSPPPWRYVGYVTLSAMVLMAGLLGWNRALNRLVNKRTAALRESEREASFLAELLERSVQPLAVGFPDGHIGRFNSAFLALTGYAKAEIERMDWAHDLTPPEWREHEQKQLAELRRTGLPVRYEKEYLRKDGTRVPIELLVDQARDSEGRTLYYYAFVTDITERKRAEEAHTRLATAVEQAAEIIIITDATAKILYVNPAFEKVTGYARQEALGQNPRFLQSGRHHATFYEEMWRVLTRGEVWRGHLFNKKKSGAIYEEETTISPIRDGAGRIINYVAVKRDVTQEVALEAQLRQSQKMEAVGQLSGGVAHDFNNILTIVHGHATMLLDGGLDPREHQECATQIIEAAERAARLTRQLLLFSRKQILLPADLDLNEVVEGMTKMLKRILGEDIALSSKLAPALPLVSADAGMLEQILLNLAVNSRDAMPDGGRLTVGTGTVTVDEPQARGNPQAAPGSYVRLSLSDTGKGIPPEILPRIFEPFFTTKEVGKGTGLGLATVHGIVKQHRGWIEVASEVGRGTSFDIYLPAVPGPRRGPKPAGAAEELPAGQETLLVVEDEPVLRQLTSRVLQRCGYTVLQAPSGAAALEVWQQHHHRIHLLLTDVIMPDGVSGFDLARTLQGEKPGLKVIFASGYSAAAQSARLVEGENFLQKPYSLQHLARTVRKRLDQGASHAPGSCG